MSRIRKALAATTALAAVAIAAPAIAGGLDPAPAPIPVAAPAPVAFSWTGFYVGGGLGMGSSNYELGGSYFAPPPAPGPITVGLDLPDLGGTGMLGSLRAGYDYQVNESFVVGASVDAMFTDVTNDTSLFISAPDLFGPIDGAVDSIDFGYELTPSEMYTIAARAGYVVNESTMFYGLVGHTRGTFEGDLSLGFTDGTLGAAPPITGSYDFDLNGLTLGFGMETMLADNLSLGIEYRYTDFERYSFVNAGGVFLPGDSIELGFDTVVQSVQALVSYRF